MSCLWPGTHMKWDADVPFPSPHAGGWLHGARGGRSGPETGAHQSREACAQLHDGYAAHQAGKDASPHHSYPLPVIKGRPSSPYFCTHQAHSCVCQD